MALVTFDVVNFVEIPSQNGPLLLNLDHITSLQVRAGDEKACILLGVRGTSEIQEIPCVEAEQVYEFLRDQLRPTSFLKKTPAAVGFAALASTVG
jgi:hypothetical protein